MTFKPATDVISAGEEQTVAAHTRLRLTRAQRWRHILIFCLAFAISAAYAWAHLKTGWIPVDDGTLAQSAYRVLNGELPHRDFAEDASNYLPIAEYPEMARRCASTARRKTVERRVSRARHCSVSRGLWD